MKTPATVLLLLWVSSASGQESVQGPKPAKEHEYLKQFEGKWEAVSRFMMEPGKPAVESKGTETGTMTCNGLWLVFEYRGEMMGQTFTGHGTMGYDLQKKKFVGSWIDSMATGLFIAEGTSDEKGTVFTMVMEGTDPMTGKTLKMKQVSVIKDKDTKTLTFSMPGPDGKDMMIGTIEYKRKK